MTKEKVVHKIAAPARVAPVSLKAAVLCKKVTSIDILVSKSINHVTCPVCWELWKSGVYV